MEGNDEPFADLDAGVAKLTPTPSLSSRAAAFSTEDGRVLPPALCDIFWSSLMPHHQRLSRRSQYSQYKETLQMA